MSFRFPPSVRTTFGVAVAAGLLALALTAPGLSAQANGAVRILVEPDALVSRDGAGAHVELQVAAHPRWAQVLLGTAIAHGRPDGSPGTRVYASADGGSSWTEATFPEQRRWGGADPQVAFTPAGTALFATLNSRPDETGRSRAFLHVYRSEDGGRSWSTPADLGASWDHPMIAVDGTVGPFAGRTYVSVLFGREYNLGVFRSTDDGRTFVGPVTVTRAGGGSLGYNVTPMVVLSDGTLLMTWQDFPLGSRRAEPGGRTSTQWSAISDDGGVTFGPARPGPEKAYPSYESEEIRLYADPSVAVDLSTRFRDRVYMAWTDHRSGHARIMVSHSTDRGATWSEPVPVDTGAPSASQFQPAIAVNRDGILGVAWYDTRSVEGEFGFHEYFSASLDGGETFLPPARVSSEASRPFGPGNLTLTPTTFTTPGDSGAVRLVFLSPAGRWGNGGDYMGMTSSADGTFHPFWADARTGTYEIWTARIRVDTAASSNTVHATGLEERDVTPWVEFVPDPSRTDAAGDVELRLRLRNASNQPIHGPLRVTVEKFGSGMGDEFRDLAPEILNATNGLTGPGAVFDFTDALGTSRVLEPGKTSGAVLLRFRLKNPLRVPDMHLRVTGRVAVR